MSWIENKKTLQRTFEFKDFSEAFAFISRVALLAESQQHHPTIENTFNKVTLTLSTHDADNTVTQKDRDLAETINALL